MYPNIMTILFCLYEGILGAFYVAKIHRREKSDRYWIVFGILYAALEFGLSFFSDILLVCSIFAVPILLCQSFRYRGTSTSHKLFPPFLFAGFATATKTVMTLLWSTLFRRNLTQILQRGAVEACFLFLSATVMLTALCVYTDKFTKDRLYYKKSDLFAYLLSSVLTDFLLILLVFLDIRYGMERYHILFFLLALGMAGVNLLSLWMFLRAVRITRFTHEREILEALRQSEGDRYEEIRNLYRQTQQTRHDLKEHLAYLKGLASEGKQEELIPFIAAMENKMLRQKYLPQLGNRTVDCILGAKSSENPEIVFSVAGEADTVPILPEWEYAALLGNMLQNAIDAVRELPEEQRQIRVIFEIIGNYQNITCKNPIPVSVLAENPSLKTTKKTEGHGWGIVSMRRIAADAGGMIEFYEEPGFFYAHCALPLPAADKA